MKLLFLLGFSLLLAGCQSNPMQQNAASAVEAIEPGNTIEMFVFSTQSGAPKGRGYMIEFDRQSQQSPVLKYKD